jgi:integrase/recombinase XerC
MPTWAEALAEFETQLNESALTPGTVAGYVGDLRSFSSWLSHARGRQAGPAEFTLDDVSIYLKYLLETRELSPATINRRVQSVRKFSRFAVQSGLRDTNPTAGVKLLRRPVGWGPRTLAPSEIARLDEAAVERRSKTAMRDRAIMQLLLQTGIRVGELAALRLGDVELGAEEASLTIRGVTDRPSRNVALSEIARDALLAYLGQDRLSQTGHVFLNRDGQSLSVRTVQQIVAELGKAAGVSVSARTLRDTYASMLWHETGDLTLVAQRMGYRRSETAVKHITPLIAAGPSTEVLAKRPALS